MLTAPSPRADSARHLSPQTLAWLADRPHARQMVRSMWEALTELEQAGHHPGAISRPAAPVAAEPAVDPAGTASGAAAPSLAGSG
ncbi:MAG: hypothetical protein ACRDSO_16020 [Pseudonocardiaceae bacterium]